MTLLVRSRSFWLAETNCFLVGADGQAILIDAPPDPVGIAAFLREFDLVPTALLLTHGHIDHMGAAGAVQRSSGAAVYVHRDDDFLTLDPETQLRSWFGMIPQGDFAPPEKIDSLHHRQTLDVAGVNLEVRHTPGHTPGHCCFYVESEGILFSGDQLFSGSVGRTDLPGGDWGQLLESMATQVLDLDDEVRVLPGHGPETTIGRERRHNPFLVDLSS